MKATSADISIRQASWQHDHLAISVLRREVFIKEQGVPEELEWDGLDEEALHLIAEDDTGQTIATARMLSDGHIGRVAVEKSWRGVGVGNRLMHQLLELARLQGYRQLFLDAQVDAIEFYRKLGFTARGEVFLDAGIPHRHMFLELQ